MPDELILYTIPYTRGRVARWMLEETGAAYQALAIGMRTLGGVTGSTRSFALRLSRARWRSCHLGSHDRTNVRLSRRHGSTSAWKAAVG